MSLVIGFPVPFLMVIGAPVWMILLLGCFAKCWRHHIRGNSALQTQIVDGMKMFVVQMSMIVIYPFYNYIFTRLSSVEQAWFSLVLLIIKLAIKNGISYYIRSNTDMQPEIVVFNVDVFNALFVSFSMQNSTSKLTVMVIIIVDFIRMASSFREVMQLVRELKRMENHINVLKTVVQGNVQSSHNSGNALTRACSIVLRRSFASKNHELRRLSTKMGPTLQIKPPIYIKKIYPTQGPTFPARAHKSLESRTPEPSHGTSKSSSGTNAQNNLVFMERLYARKVLNLLHLTEFTILVEYIEVVVPVVYCEHFTFDLRCADVVGF
ncbi:hypothetical protein JG687_00000068 [Phytophthora cactorum]|uniref:Uncharacterized protein n=1 Tax=Phytophthora cactorum TaxID=29920 RepID=A0A8T1V644_9STRA|nr:hypothetical protein JG687_00000068 [Phytophthora cactorum]